MSFLYICVSQRWNAASELGRIPLLAMAAVKTPFNNDIRRAGVSTIAALEAIGLQGCFVGGYAYSLLGIKRTVNVCVALHSQYL